MVPGPAARRGPQTFLLVFDDLSFVPGAGKTLVTAAERMLDSLDLADLVGVATTSGFGPKVAPTRSRADVREALKTLVGTSVATADPFYVAGWEALEIERGFPRETIGVVAGRECAEVDLGPACPDMVRSRARYLARTMREQFEQQLSSFRQLAEAMSRAPAPRAVVLLSAGALLLAAPDLRAAMEALSDAAAVSGVQVYSLIDDGDPIDMRDTSDARSKARRNDSAVLMSGMQSVTAAAGGTAFRVIGTADRFFDRVISETSALYRLGIEMPSQGETGPIKADVSVRRRGVTVRTTGRAVAAPEAAPPRLDEVLKRKLEAGGSESGVALSVATRLRKHTGAGLQIVVDARVPPTAAAPVTLLFGLLDAKGAVVFAARKELASTTGGELRTLFPIPVPSAEYRLRVVGGDADHRVGALELPVSATLTRSGDVELSDVLTVFRSDNGTEAFSAFEEIPASAERVSVSLELYADGASARLETATVRFTISAPGSDEPLDLQSTTPVFSGDRWTASAALPLGALPAGRYDLRATVWQGGVEVGRQSRPLTKR
jgi:hypothetical protein